MTQDETVAGCPVCGGPLAQPGDKGACPDCGSRARIRALGPIFRQFETEGFKAELPVLAFAAPHTERKMLSRLFPSIISVSLYGEYGKDHRSGVDARALTGIASGSCSGWCASLLFDYFAEHRAALAEAYRVLAPGGKFLTHIANYRLLDGKQPPQLRGPLKSKPSYLTETWSGQIPTVSVGRQWFIDTMQEVGFTVEHKRIRDAATGEVCEWFIGTKRAGEAARSAAAGHDKLAPSAAGIDDRVSGCTVCGDPLTTAGDKGACPACQSRARIRVLDPIFRRFAKDGFTATLPVLAFAAPDTERKMLLRVFPAITSVSLLGEYGDDHRSGVDARALTGIASQSCSGWFASLLFDYFTEHRAALEEAHRVLVPGGKFLTHIANYRLVDGAQPPRLLGPLRSRPEYITGDWHGQIPSVSVGRQWFIDTMREVGFAVEHLRLLDEATGEVCEWFIGTRLADAAPARYDDSVAGCPVCGDQLTVTGDKGACPSCKSRANARAIDPLMQRLVREGFAPKLPVLAFSAPDVERKLLRQAFPAVTSVSLYGDYGENHRSGVDARTLPGFADGSFSGWFASRVFDYFTEQRAALEEAHRVLVPGGKFFTHIASYRLADGGQPPRLLGPLKSKPSYLSEAEWHGQIPSVSVGRQWFLDTMEDVGFAAERRRILDAATGEITEWFIGTRLAGATKLRPAAVAPPAAPTETIRSYSMAVDPSFGFNRISVKLSLPPLPKGTLFAYHTDEDDLGNRQILCAANRKVAVSQNLGESWSLHEVAGLTEPCWNVFPLPGQRYLLQTKKAAKDELLADTYLLDGKFQIVSQVLHNTAPWHGSRSIDRHGRVVIFGEYRLNKDDQPHVESCIYRSADDGQTWQRVLVCQPSQIRHFHTVVHDRHAPGTWWASSGDLAEHCRIWQSRDDGLTWQEVTSHDTPEIFARQRPQLVGSTQRYTDVVVTEDRLLWGTDDWLGASEAFTDESRKDPAGPGSRLISTAKSLPLRLEVVALVGNPVRSIIDIGTAYLMLTQAKTPLALPAQVLLVSKSQPTRCEELFRIDHPGGVKTSFTFSRSSRRAVNGRFFSYRAGHDVFDGGPRVLQWDVTLS